MMDLSKTIEVPIYTYM